MSNKNLNDAKKAKNDEFFTRTEDIDKELANYQDFFKDKVVYCNCDHPTDSNFTRYFLLNFEKLGLKKLVSTCFISNGKGWVGAKEKDCEYTVEQLEGNGDFRSEECIEFLKEADVVVTNPPFSLFRDYVKQLMDYGKKFLILGNNNAITYKENLPYIKNNELWLGFSANKTMKFQLSDSYEKWDEMDKNGKKYGKVPAITWFTNIPHNKRNQPLDLYRKYNPTDYPKYDNYDAIEVSKVTDIPEDYNGVMGVPITFLDKYCPTQFQIVDAREVALYDKQKNKQTYLIKDADGSINGKNTYARICIKRIS